MTEERLSQALDAAMTDLALAALAYSAVQGGVRKLETAAMTRLLSAAVAYADEESRDDEAAETGGG